MRRMHLFEWEDLPWFPKSWRDYGTDYLRFVARKFNIYDSTVPLIQSLLSAAKNKQWVDLASGGGSAIVPLAKKLHENNPELKVILTDLYPNHQAFEKTKEEFPAVIFFEKMPVSAVKVPHHLKHGIRTLFGAFHHFKPEQAKKILQSAVDDQVPVAIFEPVGRNAVSWFSMLFVIINVLIFTPFIRPVRWKVLPFIYIIPVIPLYILWDGIVSILRTYSKKECEELILSLRDTEKFEWEVGHTNSKPAPVCYLSGIPKHIKGSS